MNKILLWFFIISASTAFGQKSTPKPNSRADSSKHAFVKSTGSDTLSLHDKDSLKYSVATDGKPEIKMLIIKESCDKNEDFFKYIFPIITLLLGVCINKLLEYLSERKKIKKSGKQWFAEMAGLEDPIKNQIKELGELLKKEYEGKYGILPLRVITNLDCESFKTLEKTDLIKYLELHKKLNFRESVKTSNEAYGCISILADLHKSLKGKFNQYLDGTTSLIAQVNRNLQSLSQAFGQYQVLLEKELKADPINDPRYRPILDLFDQYIEPHRKDGAYDLFLLEEHFFEPLTEILAHLRHDDRTSPMTTFSIECINAIKGIRMEKHYWIENMKIIIGHYEEQIKDLEIIDKKIE